MNFDKFATNVFLKDEIYFSKDNREISYPKESNQLCYQIEQNSFWFSHRNNCIIETVKKYTPAEIFFDIGGGNGFVAKGLEDENIETVLIEPGIEGVLNAKKRGLKNVVCSTLEDAGFKKSSLMAVGLFDVVEHIEDHENFIKSIHSFLDKDGTIYITVPAFKFLWSKEDSDAGHYRRYTKNTLSQLLKSQGFKIEYFTYIFSILPIPVFFSRTIPSLLGFTKNSNDSAKYKNEHAQKKGFLNTFLNKVWAIELSFIKKNKSIPFGGSCFIVAKKI